MLFSLRPVFVGWMVLVGQIPAQLCTTLWAGHFFGGMLHGIGVMESASDAGLVIGALTFVGFPVFIYAGRKLIDPRTTYAFYADRLEIVERFFTVERTVVKFRDVTDVTLHQNFLQRACGVGTVHLTMPATRPWKLDITLNSFGFHKVSERVVDVRDIADPDAAFKRTQALVRATSQQPACPLASSPILHS
jgi:hypothetical protein